MHWWNILKILGVLIICFIPMIMYLFIPKTIEVRLIIIFKTAVPLFMVAFLFFSFGFYEFIVTTCGSKEILLSFKNKEN